MKKDKYLIALAGLFHDIGKFYQRANPKKEDIPQDFHHYLKKENYKNEFQYQHAAYSLIALKTHLNEGLTSVFSQKEIDMILEGVYHHKPKNELQHLIQKADWVSSSERADKESIYNLELLPEDKIKDLKSFAQNNPRLRSIFENIELNKEPKPENYFYSIKPLNLSDDIFPSPLEKAYIDIEFQGKKEEEILGSYSKQWKNFQKEFNQKLKNSGLSFNSQPEKVFSLIYHLLYKYLWCIPASTYDKENYSNHYPDISLFDHSRVLSAVACCFYDFSLSAFTQKNMNQFKEETKNAKIFLHIKADISGIQKFIYNVHEGIGGVAKTLRGRSFYVALLPEVLARYILDELEYPLSNLIYCGGGVFEIIVANTKQNREKLKHIKTEIDEFLSSTFEADLGLSLGSYEYSPVEMMENYPQVLENLNENLDNAKKKRFDSLIENGTIFEYLNERSEEIEGNKIKCPVCQTYLIGEKPIEENQEDHSCELCKTFKDIGELLPKTDYLIFAKDRTDSFKKNKNIIDFEDFGIVYLFTNEGNKDDEKDLKKMFEDPETTDILKINSTDIDSFTTGFKFMGKTVPRLTEDIQEDEEEFKKGQIAPFSILAKYSEGDDRIGIVRMDVDNLGRLFADGLQKNNTISRVATLSRSLDLFFAGYLNKICEDFSEKFMKEYTNKEIDNLFYILYSGGDDLFIVAPWDKAIEIGERINEKFREYTCQNPNITISAGYIQTKPKFPIRVSANLSGEAEEIAKKSGKDCICALGDVMGWDDIETIKEIANEWVENIKDNQLQRGFIFAIHRLKEQFLKEEAISNSLIFPYKDQPDPMFYPYLQYYIARNVKDEDIKNKAIKLLMDIKNKENLKKLTFLINYVSLKTRNN